MSSSRISTNFYSRASARRDFLKVQEEMARRTFLLTRLCEARRRSDSGSTDPDPISTHAPLRGATLTVMCSASKPAFLLTRLCEARLHLQHMGRPKASFYSRASARRDIRCEVMPQPMRRFYSRASARRDLDFLPFQIGLTVSTHAPLRGATEIGLAAVSCSFVSTHAPLRGATDYARFRA